MSTYVDKPISLIEKKKQQWAKERVAEIAMVGIEIGTILYKTGKALLSLFRNSLLWDLTCLKLASRRVSRVGSTLGTKHSFRLDPSSTGNASKLNQDLADGKDYRRSSLPPLQRAAHVSQYSSIDLGGETSGYGSDNPHNSSSNINMGYESSTSSFKDDRPKWKADKSAFWEQSEQHEPPNWVKRGLQQDMVEIVVSNTSPAESPSQDGEERPCTSSSSNNNRSYIRGQNIPLDSSELAERERRRQIALAHQEAVRQQLEERERRRKEEKAQRIREEQEEELRIEREQAEERRRKEQELQQLRQKQEREAKRKEAIRQALELAEKEAKVEKDKLKTNKQNHIETNNSTLEKIDKENINQQLALTPRLCDEKEPKSPRESPRELPIPKPKEVKNEPQNQQQYQMLTPRSEMAFILQTPSTLDSMQMPYAVLVPQTSAPIAIPVSFNPGSTDRSIQSTSRTENRLLTPTQYRCKNKVLCDSSTQTEPELLDSNNLNRFLKEKNTNLELNYDNRSRREKRNSAGNVEDRPKWNANRPPTRYLKQSEKDLLYQRKKQRSKLTRDYKNSSDESGGSPRFRKKNFGQKRAMWRNSDQQHYFARNIRMYQTEIVPLEVDKEQIYYRNKCECCRLCGCAKSELKNDSPRVSLPDCSSNTTDNSSYVIDKLSSLHNGLLMKQEQWARSPRTPYLSSPSRNTET